MSASRLDLPTPSGPMKPIIAPRRQLEIDVGERHGAAVAQPDAGQRATDRRALMARGSLTSRFGGHCAFGSSCT